MKIVSKKLASGQIRLHAYAYIGGPKVATATGSDRAAADVAMARALSEPAAIAKLAAALEVKDQKARPTVAYIGGLVLAYLESPEFARLADRTRADYRRHLNDFREEFGDWRTSLFEDPRTTQDLAEWRDEHPSERQGHMRIQVVSVLFGWARSRGITRANPTEAIITIYKSDRSDLIWSDAELSAVLAESNDAIARAIRFAAETGLRQGDLVRLPWSAISDVAIHNPTSKRGKRVIIPIAPALRRGLRDGPHGHPRTRRRARRSRDAQARADTQHAPRQRDVRHPRGLPHRLGVRTLLST